MENLTVYISQEIKIVITGTKQNDSLYLLTHYITCDSTTQLQNLNLILRNDQTAWNKKCRAKEFLSYHLLRCL